MAVVVIGVDPAKRSNTIEVLDSAETVLMTARFENTREDYRRMLALVKRWPQRSWAVEGVTGVGLSLAQRLVADGERVLDVPFQALDPGARDRHRAWPQERPDRCPRGRGGGSAHGRSA